MTSGSAYLSMTELARRLDLPESTMRYYCKRFAEFLPYKGEGRRRRYAGECEKTLVFIASAMHRNKNATAVELMLQSGQFGHASLAQATAAEAGQGGGPGVESVRLLMGVMERQASALGKITEGLEVFLSELKNGARHPGVPGEPSGAGGVLRNELEELRLQIFTAEKVHQEDLEQLRKWIARLGEAVARLS